jgi:hypothetical protein
MKKVIAAVLSAVLVVALLVTGSVVSDEGNAQVDVSGNWIVEDNTTYVTPPWPIKDYTFPIRLCQSGNDVTGAFVFNLTPTIQFKGTIFGEVYDDNTIVLTRLQLLEDEPGYIGITRMRGEVSLNGTISGTSVGSDNNETDWKGTFRAYRPTA